MAATSDEPPEVSSLQRVKLGPANRNARAMRLAVTLPSAPIVRFAVKGEEASSGFTREAMALHRRWKFVVFGSRPRPMNAPVVG